MITSQYDNYEVPSWGHYPVLKSSTIGKGFSFKEPSAKNSPWSEYRSKEEWAESKRRYLRNYKIFDQASAERFRSECIVFNEQVNSDVTCSHGVCYPSATKSITPTATITPSPFHGKEAIPPKSKTRSPFLKGKWEPKKVIPPDYDIRDYELVMDKNGRLVPRTDHKLAEKPLNDTHPTVLTWLIRYVDLQDIIQMINLLNFSHRRGILTVECRSLKRSFEILEPTDGFIFSEWSQKYEGVGEPPFIGEILKPIIT